ncbi:MAG: hypothetical protein LBT00_07945 [Spirochaetaceae bacterium]|nr:hypothetical protein [Spirochaetaceae bacterium]
MSLRAGRSVERAKQSRRDVTCWIASLGNVPLARNDEGLARNDGRLACNDGAAGGVTGV